MRELSRSRLLAAFLGLGAVGAIGELLVDRGAMIPQLALVAPLLTATALAYRPGDPPRRAWIWLACAAWLAVVGESAHLLFGPPVSRPLMSLSNALWCVSLLDARRKIVRGALVPPLARPWRWALAAAVLVAVLVAIDAGRELLAADRIDARQFHIAFVQLCDGVVLIAGTWLLGALHPLWGGAAARPFLLVTAAAGCFAASDLAPVFALLPAPRLWIRALIIGGWALLGVAGLAQLELRRAMFARTADLQASLRALGPRR
ncbi:hypothetical protein [Nannocystis radixulma]|uniref:Uncharacterized protein n=1 Tax=Nannocystis radixulma TaxID=2995305 RepID=A0ABT5B1W7_9BACT|nr:hypothetical protein [Nannocystis radixulma]MDC0667529.1 hypothetical protein [Nannocystis radixulma]